MDDGQLPGGLNDLGQNSTTESGRDAFSPQYRPDVHRDVALAGHENDRDRAMRRDLARHFEPHRPEPMTHMRVHFSRPQFRTSEFAFVAQQKRFFFYSLPDSGLRRVAAVGTRAEQ